MVSVSSRVPVQQFALQFLLLGLGVGLVLGSGSVVRINQNKITTGAPNAMANPPPRVNKITSCTMPSIIHPLSLQAIPTV